MVDVNDKLCGFWLEKQLVGDELIAPRDNVIRWTLHINPVSVWDVAKSSLRLPLLVVNIMVFHHDSFWLFALSPRYVLLFSVTNVMRFLAVVSIPQMQNYNHSTACNQRYC